MKSKVTEIGFREYARYFSLSDACEILPLVRTITHKTYESLQPQRLVLRKMSIIEPISSDLENAYRTKVCCWVEKMKRLGVKPISLGVVSFDTGYGYLNWKYPEMSISYFYDYDVSFKERTHLERVLIPNMPDWAY